MKKLITWTSLILAASLFAEPGDDKGQLKRSMKVVPMHPQYLSHENGGENPAYIVLADGVGIYTTQEDEYAKAISYLNGKYGEDAKKAGETSLKEYVLDTGTKADEADKELAEKLVINTGGSVEEGGSVKEGPCDDGESDTINDTYQEDGTCKGTPKEEESNAITCKDPDIGPGDYVTDEDGVKYLVVEDGFGDFGIKKHLDKAEFLCTSRVTNMASLFNGNQEFNEDISKWDTSNVTDMNYMFFWAKSFNQPIGNWKTGKVTDMSYMFYDAISFDKPLNWDTSKVTDMYGMFHGASPFNQPLNWNTSSVTNMAHMFGNAYAFDQPLNWNTSNVTRMDNMFNHAYAFDQPLNWNTSKVTSMSGMFVQAKSFNQPLNWDTSNVTDMSIMLYYAQSFDQPLNWNTSKVTNMSQMLYYAQSFNQSLNWDTSNVTNMYQMFRYTTLFNKDISGWDVSKVTSYYQFAQHSSLTSANAPIHKNGNRFPTSK